MEQIATYVIPGYFVVAMALASMNSKALGLSIAFSLGLLACNGDNAHATFLFVFLLPFYLLASFRD
jgi:hypothetical protein